MDFKLPVYTCKSCNRKRQGEPTARPDLYPEPICRYCVERFEHMLATQAKTTITVWKRPRLAKSYPRKVKITCPDIPLSYVKPNLNDLHPPTLTQYLVRWRLQKGKCTGCRHKFEQMYAVWTANRRKLTGLRCKSCHEALQRPKLTIPEAEKPKIPEWWTTVPWYVREFMWQNPSVREEFKQLGLTKE